MDEAPKGQLFSEVYLERGAPTRDSRCMRRRLCSQIQVSLRADALFEAIRSRLGIDVPYGSWGADWQEFFEHAELRDILDVVTLHYRVFADYRSAATAWLRFVEQVFREENTAYRVDEAGGVHFYVDEEFEANRRAAVAALGSSKYGAVSDALLRGYQALDGATSDTTGAVRGVFDAAEIMFKLMFDRASRLGAAEINQMLKPRVSALYQLENDQIAAKLLCGSFGDWVNAAHHYRHLPGTEEKAPPPIDLAIALVSAGAGHVRWLAGIDERRPTA